MQAWKHECMDQQTEKMDTKQPRVRYPMLPQDLSVFPQTLSSTAPSCVPGCSRTGPHMGDAISKRSSVTPPQGGGTKASRNSILKLFPLTCWSLTNLLLPSGRCGLCTRSTCLSQQPHMSCPAHLVCVPKSIAARQDWHQPGPSAQPEEGAGPEISLHLMCSSPELGILPGDPCGYQRGPSSGPQRFHIKSRVKPGVV